MRSNGSSGLPVVIGLGLMFVCLLAAVFACAFAGRDVATHSIDVYVTTQAQPPSVAERAEAIRQETRLDNPQGVPTVFWLMTLIIILGLVYLFAGPRLLEAIANRDKQRRLLHKKGRRQMPAPSPYEVIDQPQFPQLPHLPQRPQLPQLPWAQSPGGESDV